MGITREEEEEWEAPELDRKPLSVAPTTGGGDEWVNVEYLKSFAETPKGVLLGKTENTAEWYPKSQMRIWPHLNDVGLVTVKSWVARKNGVL